MTWLRVLIFPCLLVCIPLTLVGCDSRKSTSSSNSEGGSESPTTNPENPDENPGTPPDSTNNPGTVEVLIKADSPIQGFADRNLVVKRIENRELTKSIAKVEAVESDTIRRSSANLNRPAYSGPNALGIVVRFNNEETARRFSRDSLQARISEYSRGSGITTESELQPFVAATRIQDLELAEVGIRRSEELPIIECGCQKRDGVHMGSSANPPQATPGPTPYSFVPLSFKFYADKSTRSHAANGFDHDRSAFPGINQNRVQQIVDEDQRFEELVAQYEAYLGLPDEERSQPGKYQDIVGIKTRIESFLQSDSTYSGAIVDFDYVRQPMAFPTEIIDDLYDLQWHYNAIRVDKAWQLFFSDTVKSIVPELEKSVTIAIIDTGIKGQHPDLEGLIVNQQDFISDPARSLDGDGRDGNADDPGDHPRFPSYHGTHVGGTIAGKHSNTDPDSNNFFLVNGGVVGVFPGVNLMILRVLGAGGGVDSEIAKAILYAKDNGADIINLSLGGPGYSRILESAIEDAIAKGVVVVAAAGNEATNQPSYPAAFADVIAVGSVRRPDTLRGQKITQPNQLTLAKSYSNWGTNVLLTAPGGRILSETERLRDGLTAEANAAEGVLSTFWQGDSNDPELGASFTHYEGTSMASPHIAGVAGMIRAILGKDENGNAIGNHYVVRSILTASSVPPDLPDPDEPGNVEKSAKWIFEHYGYGILDAEAALNLALGIHELEANANIAAINVMLIQGADDDVAAVAKQDISLKQEKKEIRSIFSGVKPGTYRVLASTDEDNDAIYCENGDYCGLSDEFSVTQDVPVSPLVVNFELMRDSSRARAVKEAS